MKTDEQRARAAAYMRSWYAADPERKLRARAAAAAKRKADPLLAEHYRKLRRDQARRLRAADPQLRLKDALRSRVRVAVHGYAKGSRSAGSAVRDLGCTLGELRVHLEKQFAPGMTWDNYGKWHVDHRKPLSLFDLTDRAQLLEACHYENLQPLWAADNRSKGDKVS